MQSLGPNANRHLAGRWPQPPVFGIGISIQQVVQVGALVQLQLEEPAVPVWIGVDGLLASAAGSPR